MTTQNLIQRHTIQIRQADIQQNQLCAKLWKMILGILPITKKVQPLMPITFQQIAEQTDQPCIIFNNSDQPVTGRRLLPINNH